MEEARRKFRSELEIWLRQGECKEEGVEKAWQGFRDTIKDVAEKVVGKSRNRGQRRVTSWWNEEVKTNVRRKKKLYKRALRGKSVKAWKDNYKRVSKKTCCERGKGGRLAVMWEGAAEEFPQNRRAFCKKINGKEEGLGWNWGLRARIIFWMWWRDKIGGRSISKICLMMKKER